MTFRVILPPDILALAMVTAEERPKNVVNHIPLIDPNGELSGAVSEHGWAWSYRMPQSLITSDGMFGDGGIDFTMEQGTVDIKSSSRYSDSWVVKRGRCRADWYVFATVILPGTVIFKGKATREMVEAFPLVEKVGNNRLVTLNMVDDIVPSDFSY